MTTKNNIKENAQLMLYLTALNKEEWRQFGDFVRSPIYNKQEKIVQLYVLLSKKFRPDAPLSKTDLLPVLGKKKRYAKDYAITKEEDGHLRRLFSTFTNLIKEFLTFIKAKDYPTYNQRVLVSALMERKAYELVPSIIKKQKKTHLEENVQNNRSLLNYFLLREAEFFLNIIQQNRTDLVTTEDLIGDFRNYYIGTLLKFFCAAKNKEKILNVDHQYPEFSWLIAYLEKNWASFEPVIQAYFAIIKLQESENGEKWFAIIKHLMNDASIRWEKPEQREIYSHMLNYCSRCICAGQFKYQLEKHQIYLRTLQLNVWTSGLYFSQHHYINIVQNALQLEKREWAATFIDDFAKELPLPAQEQIPLLAKVYLCFSHGNFDQTQEFLLQVNDAEDFFYTLYIRKLRIQLHYEQYDEALDFDKQPLPYALEALRAYLHRNGKMAPPVKTAYSNFMKISERLYRLLEKPSANRNIRLLDRLLADINKAELLEERRWLSEKTTSLMEQTKLSS